MGVGINLIEDLDSAGQLQLESTYVTKSIKFDIFLYSRIYLESKLKSKLWVLEKN